MVSEIQHGAGAALNHHPLGSVSETVAVSLMSRVVRPWPKHGRNTHNSEGNYNMTYLINEATAVANTIATKEAEISSLRSELNVEEDKFNLITLIAVEAVNADILRQRKGRKADAGAFLTAVCFDVLGQKNKSGKGKKLSENAQKLAKDDDFAEVIAIGAAAINKTTQESSAWTDAISVVSRDVADICEELEINSYNNLVQHLNPKEEVSDEEKLVALAQKLVKANGADIDTVEGKTAVWELIQNAADIAKVGSGYDDNVTVLKSDRMSRKDWEDTAA